MDSREETLLLQSDTLCSTFVIYIGRLIVSDIAEIRDVLKTPLHEIVAQKVWLEDYSNAWSHKRIGYEIMKLW